MLCAQILLDRESIRDKSIKFNELLYFTELEMENRKTLQGYFSPMPSAGTPCTRQSANQAKKPRLDFNPDDIIANPACRKPIEEYDPDIRAEVMRAYLLKGPTRPIGHAYPKHSSKRSFQETWFEKYDWLEYSVSKDAAFCLYCFLFKSPGHPKYYGSDTFTKIGFINWRNDLASLTEHNEGKTHNNARSACDDFKNQRTSIASKLRSDSKESEVLYKTRLTASLDCARFLLMQGEPFRGHDESSSSINKGNFREMVDWYKDKVTEVKEAFDKAPRNCLMISPDIQKDLAKACAQEVTTFIKSEIGARNFAVLIDESRDSSIKEQMAVIVRYMFIFVALLSCYNMVMITVINIFCMM